MLSGISHEYGLEPNSALKLWIDPKISVQVLKATANHVAIVPEEITSGGSSAGASLAATLRRRSSQQSPSTIAPSAHRSHLMAVIWSERPNRGSMKKG